MCTEAITVLLRRGASFRECTKLPENRTNPNHQFTKYLCSEEGDWRLGGWFADAVEITTLSPWTVNLTNLRMKGSLGWLVIKKRKIGKRLLTNKPNTAV